MSVNGVFINNAVRSPRLHLDHSEVVHHDPLTVVVVALVDEHHGLACCHPSLCHRCRRHQSL